MYNSCIRGTIIYSLECWALRQEDEKPLEYTEREKLLWLFNINKERFSINSLLI